MGLKKVYTIGWLTLAVFIFLTEFLMPAGAQDALRFVGVVFFGLLEGFAIQRPKPGDTLSEHVWAFYRGKKARLSLVVSWALYFVVAIINIAVDPDLMVGRAPLTVLIIGFGLFGWLVPHFILKGKEG